ncbi:hypothetical protein [Ochrobactrum sp. C6C9]|uniref:hypothetical protein n=1 Tax=Ochrobactrum sp. C6C9 TaxID=2736662 RepID=UPI003530096F
MRIGRDRPRLSERLASDIENKGIPPPDAESASPPKTLESFENDYRRISTDALTTIERDMAAFVSTTRSMIEAAAAQIGTELAVISKTSRNRLWIMSASVLIAIAISVFASFWFTRLMMQEARSVSLSTIGLQASQTKAGLVVTWDETRLQLGQCQTGQTITPCLLSISK